MKINVILFFVLLFTASLFSQEGGKVSGQVFGDYFYNIQTDTLLTSLPYTAMTGKKDSSGFQFRRINLNYDYTFSQTFLSRFRIESDQQSNTPNNRWGIFVKDAYLKWNNIFEGSDLIFGIQPTPAYDISEAFWGHRYLEKTIMDLRGVESSRDFALSLKGKFDASGMFNYWLMAGNGSGNSQESNKQKKLYGSIYIKPTDNSIISLFADYAFRPEKSFRGDDINNNDAVTTSIFLGYTDKQNYNFGLELFYQLTKNDISRIEDVLSISDRNMLGLSLFGTYNFSDKLDFTGRVDYFDPDADKLNNSRLFYIAALNYKPHPMVTIAPNILVEKFENPPGKKFDPTVTARLTIAWNYR